MKTSPRASKNTQNKIQHTFTNSPSNGVIRLSPCGVQLTSQTNGEFKSPLLSLSLFHFAILSSQTPHLLLFSHCHSHLGTLAGYDMKTLLSLPNFFCSCFSKGISAFRRSCVFFAKSVLIPMRFPRKGLI